MKRIPLLALLVAINGSSPWSTDRIVEKALEYVRNNDSPTKTFMDDARRVLPALLPTGDVPLLTDDYAPVDTMVF